MGLFITMAAITFLLVVLFASVVANAIQRISGWDLGEAGVFIVIFLMAWARARWKFWDDPNKYLGNAKGSDTTIMALPATVTFFAIAYAIVNLTFGIDLQQDHSWIPIVLFYGSVVLYYFFKPAL